MEIPKEDVAEINELVSAEHTQLVEDLILQLHEIGAVKLGNFKLKSGVMSPIYVDLRVLPSHPRVLERVVDSMWRCLTASVGEQEARKRFTHVCGVPYGALPFAAAIAIKHQVPMVICRKEAKDYGTKSLVEGVFKKDEKVLILEDVITSGISIQETSTNLRSAGLTVEEAVVFLDRQQGGRQRLAALGDGLAVTVHAVTSLRQMLETLKAHGRIEESLLDSINEYLASMAKVTPIAAVPAPALAETKQKAFTFAERVEKCKSAVGKKLLSLMEQKKSNLSVAADVTTKAELLTLADKLGPHICMLKTHADIVRDWDANTGKELKELAQKHNFLLFEDRKFADIGYVAQQQYGGGPFAICDWADIVTVHLVAGASVVTSLKETAAQKGQERGALLIAQMSTADAASKQEEGSVERALAAARAHTDFVVGFICQENVLKNGEEGPSFLYCTPGVRIGSQGDGLGQTYRTPEMVIDSGCDVAIVGRGICSAQDPVAAAREYQEKAWAAYTARCSASQ